MSTRFAPLLAFCALAAISTGCGKKETEAGSSTSREPQVVALTVKDVDLGRTINPDKSIGDGSGEFRPAETVYASVHTEGAGQGTLQARWTFQDGQVVDETSQAITTSGSTRTEFHIAKPDGFPTGKYRVQISLDGNVAASKEFEVKKG